MNNLQATVPFYKGNIVIIGNEEVITDIYYTSKAVKQINPNGEVLKAKQQLLEYVEKQRTKFDINVNISGTLFQREIYKALKEIPYNQTVSYKQLAELAGYPKAARAVGQVMAKNRLLIVLPCHRVVASSGKLGGFTGGLDLKKFLLQHESGK